MKESTSGEGIHFGRGNIRWLKDSTSGEGIQVGQGNPRQVKESTSGQKPTSIQRNRVE